MNLVIDIGNSGIKIGLFQQDELIRKEVLQSYESLQLLINRYDISKVIISSVREENSEILHKIDLPVDPTFMGADTPLPFESMYQSATIGLDRLAAVAGAWQLYPQTNILIIDAGTSITYELLNAQGVYQGGAISLGLEMRFKALNNFTARLPLVDKELESAFPERTTEKAIHSGVVTGVIAEIQAFIAAAGRENEDLKLILTGGDSKYFESRIKERIFAVPELVLVGLNAILRYNASI